MSVFLDTNTTQAPVVTTSEVVQMSAVPSETVIKSQKTAVSNVSNVSSLVAENTKKTVTLDNLSSLVQESVLPSDQETSVYLTEVSTLKKQTLEHEMLNVLDGIIDMTVSGEIGQNDIDTEIPKTIIARIIRGDFSAEYIHSSITKKWVSHRCRAIKQSMQGMVKVNAWVFILRRYKWHIHAGSWSLVNCWWEGSTLPYKGCS